jgi:hypothetical protein
MILHPASRARRLGLFGMSGSDRLGRSLAQRLDDDWHWFRSVAPGGIEPIDGVLVGPGGTFAITMAGERGRFMHRNGHWYRWNRSTESWVPWEPAPITATRLAARRLALYLERAALPPEVTPMLQPPEGATVEAAPGEQLGVVVVREADRVAALAVAEARLSQPQIDRIVALLDPRQPLPRLAPSTPSG